MNISFSVNNKVQLMFDTNRFQTFVVGYYFISLFEFKPIEKNVVKGEQLLKINSNGVFFQIKIIGSLDRRKKLRFVYGRNKEKNFVHIAQESKEKIESVLLNVKSSCLKDALINHFEIIKELIPSAKNLENDNNLQ